MRLIPWLTKYFVRGLLLVAPAAATIFVLYRALVLVDQMLDLERRLGIPVPGLGLLIIVSAVTVVGFLASGLVAGYLIALTEATFSRLPLVRLIYTALKDLLEAFVGDKRRFDRPVLVSLIPGSEAKVMGFVTRPDLPGLGMADHVAVYLPTAYSLTGHLIVVPRDRTEPLRADGAAVMTFILSGGVSGEGVVTKRESKIPGP